MGLTRESLYSESLTLKDRGSACERDGLPKNAKHFYARASFFAKEAAARDSDNDTPAQVDCLIIAASCSLKAGDSYEVDRISQAALATLDLSPEARDEFRALLVKAKQADERLNSLLSRRAVILQKGSLTPAEEAEIDAIHHEIWRSPNYRSSRHDSVKDILDIALELAARANEPLSE